MKPLLCYNPIIQFLKQSAASRTYTCSVFLPCSLNSFWISFLRFVLVSLLMSTPLSEFLLLLPGRMKHSWTHRHIHKHQLPPCLVPQNCSPDAISAIPPTLWIHELLPCHSQSPLKERQSDLSKWRNVKMPVSGLTFHLHWQFEEHNSVPGGSCEAQRWSFTHTEQFNQTIDRNS